MIKIEVAVPTPLHQTFTYLAAEAVAPGSRVLVPFGARRVVGVALGGVAEDEGANSEFKLKAITAVIDDHPMYSATVLEVARWISTYYMHPLGEVLRTMLPASSKTVVKETFVLTEKGCQERADATSAWGEVLAALFGKKKMELTASLVKAKLRRLRDETELSKKKTSIAALKREGLIGAARGSTMKARSAKLDVAESLAAGESANAAPDMAPPPTPGQQRVLAEMLTGLKGLDREGKSLVYLLHGVTGSGKTEVYLKLIAEVLGQAGGAAQALVLVPEISLTPQMTRVFARRFPGLVAVVHSAMSDADRWAELNRVRDGEAKILIGPRSAVFGPFQKLRLILVDEEHDQSYKQSTGLTYNGRDVAVLRAKLEPAMVVLGSATPSLESYHNARNGRYRLLEMMERVSGRPMPAVEVINADGDTAPKAKSRPSTLIAAARNGKALQPLTAADADIPIDARVVQALRDNLAAGRQAIVLVNRRGYAYYLFSLDQKKPVQCPNCSISMTLHARSTVLRCHYCDFSQQVAKVVRDRPEEKFVAVGYGSQKAEDAICTAVPGARIVRLDSDAVTDHELLPRTLGQFRAGEIDILVGTQILAKGHDFPNVTLIVILEVDQLLGLPDFRAGERAFQLMVQAAGRAGRAELPGKVMMQTMRPGHPVVAAAIKQDYACFVEQELSFRQAHAYPPYARMISVEFNSPDQPRLEELCRRIEGWIEQMAHLQPQVVGQVRMLGPSVPPIETIRGRHRRHLIFASDQVQPLRALVGQFAVAFHTLPNDVRMRLDVDPQSLI